ncbi:hypothetical protein C1T21_15520 [Paenibacillus sp. F4]|nr:hypothetical protein C1T21_15520 [Paenibacillus sp. F4]
MGFCTRNLYDADLALILQTELCYGTMMEGWIMEGMIADFMSFFSFSYGRLNFPYNVPLLYHPCKDRGEV